MNTTKINLRAVEPRDAQLMYQWENDRRNWYISGTTSPMPLFIIEQFTHPENQDVVNTRQLRLIIELNATQQTIGYLDLFDVDLINRKAGLGILIGDETQRNKRFAQEALEHIKKYARETLNLNQLFCNVHETNVASLHLFTKAGFEQSGVLKNWSLKSGVFENVVVMQCFL